MKFYRIQKIDPEAWEIWIDVKPAGIGPRPERIVTGAVGRDIVETYEAMPERIADVFMYGVLLGAKSSKDGKCPACNS